MGKSKTGLQGTKVLIQ